MKEEITDYLHYVTIERGLAENTRSNYQRDLERYLTFLTKQKIPTWQAVERVNVLDFLQELNVSANIVNAILLIKILFKNIFFIFLRF